jgi:hypothetical protein
MDAEVAPGEKLFSRAPDNEVLTKEAHRERSTAGKVLQASDRMPILDEDRVVDHARPSDALCVELE